LIDSESKSEYEIDKNVPSKTYKKVGFDLILKNINGKYINNFIIFRKNKK